MRPRTLTASIAPVAMGSAIAQGSGAFHLGGAIAALTGALGIQVACNFANDFFDARQGADTPQRFGPVRAVSSGRIGARAMMIATICVLLIVVTPCVVYLSMHAGWTFSALGALCVVLAFAYTGSRWSLAYLGLGDLFALLFFGPVAVAGTVAAQTGSWSMLPAFAGLGIGFLASALIGVNNVRDESTDRIARKRTLAVRCGGAWGRRCYCACVIAAIAIAIVMAASSGRWWSASAGVAGIALIPSMSRMLDGTSGRALNRELAATGRAILVYGVLFSIGWLI